MWHTVARPYSYNKPYNQQLNLQKYSVELRFLATLFGYQMPLEKFSDAW